jgi:glutamyl-tRNA synthetase
MLTREEIDALFPSDLPNPEHWEQRYPERELEPGAMVTRFCPSPTGFAHLGGVYVATLDKDLARHSHGDYFIRIEDTDQSRTVEGAMEQFDAAFSYFDIDSDETDETGSYGPYTQSARADIYLSYVREFLRDGKAYLCFTTKEELSESADEQRKLKLPTGYYGRWALWRDASAEQIREALAADKPYVVRFHSPGEDAGRVTFTDLIRGKLETAANRNDVVILKSSDSPLRLPTYQFAHVIDDHLMRVNPVIRGDEWLSSVPVHLQLFEAAGFEPIPYAHIAPLMKQEGKTKRKLSKRKDPEASVEFYINAGYPRESVLYYLRGLLNGKLAELPFEESLSTPLRLEECGVAGPLVDLVKLEDISGNFIATLSGQKILDQVIPWAKSYDPELAKAIEAEPELALRALAIERDGAENPRKDLRKWSDFRPVYGYFLTSLFEPITDPADSRFAGIPPETLRKLCADLLLDYQDTTDGDAWFDQIRAASANNGFAASVKEYKQNKENYVGSIREASQAIRLLLTGSTRSPALHLVTNALGEAETRRRIGAILPD